MAVADVFTAITEDRPYRKGMSELEAIKTMKGMAASKSLDAGIVDLLISNFDYVNARRGESQHGAATDFEEFYQSNVVQGEAW